MTAFAAGAPHIEIDGAPASAEQLSAVALSSYGHFTAMQVRGRRVRGLRLHLARLDTANRELFGVALDGARVREYIGRALGSDITDASVRVHVIESPGEPTVMITVRPPGGMGDGPWKLRSVPYQRAVAHIKRVSDFGQAYYRSQALAAGFDEALLTAPDGIISEGAITNAGFFDGTHVIWPAAPVLSGITMQLIESRLASFALPSRRCHVRLSDLGSFAAVFVTNARGIAPVSQVDDTPLVVDDTLMTTLSEVYASVPWDDI